MATLLEPKVLKVLEDASWPLDVDQIRNRLEASTTTQSTAQVPSHSSIGDVLTDLRRQGLAEDPIPGQWVIKE